MEEAKEIIYDEKGYNQEGYNRAGFDKFGYNREGYNWCGYDREGFNKQGINRNGIKKILNETEEPKIIEEVEPIIQEPVSTGKELIIEQKESILVKVTSFFRKIFAKSVNEKNQIVNEK